MKLQFYLSLGLIFIALNVGLGSWGLAESSEARYAEIAKEMLYSGDYLHPRLLGIQHYHKPPLTYYMAAIGYKLFGVNEFGARFFLCVALILQIFFIFQIAKLLFKDEKIAYASSLIYFSFPIVLISVRNLTTDAFLTTFIIGSIYFWLKRKFKGNVFYTYLFYSFLGLGFLTKGPIVLLPALVFIICWKLIKKESCKPSLHQFLGILVFLAISSSWFVLVIADIPDLWNYFIIEQIVKRSTQAQAFHRAKPVWYYLVFAPLIGLPLVFLPIIEFLKNWKKEKRHKNSIFILGCSAGISLLIFSAFSSKLILYILPIYPFFALLAGYFLCAKHHRNHKFSIYISIYKILFLVLLFGIGYLVFSEKFNFKILWAILLSCFIIGFLAYIFTLDNFKNNFKVLYISCLFSFSILFSFAVFASENPNTIHSVKPIMSFIQKEKGKKLNQVMVYNYLLPSASFYLKDSIITLQGSNFYTKREINFEKDETYKKNLVAIETPEGWRKFKDLATQKDNVLFIKKKELKPDSLLKILDNFKNRREMGKWQIYY